MTRLAYLCGVALVAGIAGTWTPAVQARQLPPPLSAWRSIGPTNIGGPVTGIATLPGNSQRLVISLLGGGILRTEDGGTTWQPVDQIPEFTIARLVGDPNTPTTLYAVTGSGRALTLGVGVLKSTDFGVTWSLLPGSPAVSPNNFGIRPNGTLVMFAGSVFESTNGGVTWTTDGITTNPNNPFPLTVYSRSSPQLGYEFASRGTHGSSSVVRRTSDGGLSYTSMGTTPLEGRPSIESALWLDPTDNLTLVGGGRDLLLSRDGGQTFSLISNWDTAPAMPGANQRVIVSDGGFNGTTNRRVWVGSDYGLFRTDDIYAATPTSGWTFALSNVSTAALEAVAASAGFVAAVTANKEAIRVDAGGTTAVKARLLGRFEPAHWIAAGGMNIGRNVAIDRDNSDLVYAVGGPVMRSLDGGLTFSPLMTSSDTQTSVLVDVAPTFRLPPSGPVSGPEDVHASGGPTGPMVIVGTGGSARTPQYNSLPFAAIQHPADGPRFERVTTADVNGAVIYGSRLGASWRSSDTGQTWTRLADLPVIINFLTTHPRNASWVYAATKRGLYRSTDAGATWTFDFPSRVPVTSLAWQGQTLVAATRGRGLWALDVTGQPAVGITLPSVGQEIHGRFTLTGFAIDPAEGSGTGVDAVHVYAYPGTGAAPLFLGVAGYGFMRTDVAALYGPRFANSGFSLVVNNLAPGAYQLVAFAHSQFDGRFTAATRSVLIRSGVEIVVENPVAGAGVRPPFFISGWAIDQGAPGGSGIDAVHVYAYPSAGGAPQFMGAALLGISRPDIGTAFGEQFSTSGYSLIGGALAPGSYTIVIYARSTVTGTFVARTVNITVQDTVDVMIDEPVTGTTVGGTSRLWGWALDSAALSGSGIGAVHVWAYPAGGGSPTFVGSATLGIHRGDVGIAYGAQFDHAGYELSLSGLPSGTWDLAVFAYRNTTGTFAPGRVVRVTR